MNRADRKRLPNSLSYHPLKKSVNALGPFQPASTRLFRAPLRAKTFSETKGAFCRLQASHMRFWLCGAAQQPYHSLMIFLYLLVGLLIGLLSGVVGIGGGVLIVPALVYVFGMSQHRAQGTSLGALLAPIGALAFWEYYKAGNVDVPAALLIALGFAVGGYFGGHWSQHLPDVVVRRAFGVLMVALGLHLVLAAK